MSMHRPAVEIVALLLAGSISVALLLLTGFALYVAFHADTVESTRVIAVTQVLTGWGGGMIGVLGAYIGYNYGKKPPDD